MLETACQQTLALDHNGLAPPIDAPRSGVLRPPERIPQLRDRKAPLLIFLLTLNGLDHGVDQVPNLIVYVVGKDAAAHPDLVSCQARTPRRGNGLFQIGHQASERIIKPVDGVTGSAQHWITEQTDGTLGHHAILPYSRPLIRSGHPAGIARFGSGLALRTCQAKHGAGCEDRHMTPSLVPAAARHGLGCRFLVAYYTMAGTAWCAYLFYLSTLPVTIPGDWPEGGGPPWLAAIAVAALLLLFVWWLFPLLLLPAGLAYLPSAALGARRWPAVWAGTVAAGITLEVLFITGSGQPDPSPAYTGPAIVNWAWLAESVGFAAVGAAMIAILAGAERSARRAAAGSPSA